MKEGNLRRWKHERSREAGSGRSLDETENGKDVQWLSQPAQMATGSRGAKRSPTASMSINQGLIPGYEYYHLACTGRDMGGDRS